jgi:ABC-type nitrate/sulfonate/bicarbonate transport system substrate-binding protein
MSNIERFARRDMLRLGGMGSLALLGGLGSTLSVSFAAEGTSAPINVITSDSTQTLTIFELIKAQRFLDKFGVSIKTLNVADASRTIPGVMGGGADVCILNGIGLTIAVIAKGAAMKIIGANSPLVQDAVYSAKPDIKSSRDLEGRVVGTGAIGALTYQLMVALLEKKGVDVGKVTFRNVGSNTDIFRAVVAGTVDAGPSGVDVYDDQAKYGVHSLTDGDLWKQLPDYIYQGAFASNHTLATKRDGLVRVLAAFSETFKFMQSPESKNAFIQARAAATGKNDTVAALSAWGFIQKYKPYAVDMRISEKSILYMQKLNIKTGSQKTVAPYSQIADMSLARDALKLVQA